MTILKCDKCKVSDACFLDVGEQPQSTKPKFCPYHGALVEWNVIEKPPNKVNRPDAWWTCPNCGCHQELENGIRSCWNCK